MGSFEFWRRWLFGASLFFGLFGIVAAIFGDTVLFTLWKERAAAVFWDAEAMPAEANRFRLFLFGPLGGTIAGTYVLQAYIAHYPFRRKEKWAWRASVLALLTWFGVDSAVSVYHGAIFNVYLVNVFALIGIGLPLAATWQDFKD